MAIVVDTSALVAIFRLEIGWERLQAALEVADSVVIPSTCLVEAALLRRHGQGLTAWISELEARPLFEIASITPDVADVAAEAARRYGKGSGHPAQLNFGDCLSYAVAKSRALPLLYVGDDFSQTDIDSVL
jgi:ribonuclease VapC